MSGAVEALIAALHWLAPCAALLAMHGAAEHDPDDPASALRLERWTWFCRRGGWLAWGAAVIADVVLFPSLSLFVRLHHGALDIVGLVLLLLLLVRRSRPLA